MERVMLLQKEILEKRGHSVEVLEVPAGTPNLSKVLRDFLEREKIDIVVWHTMVPQYVPPKTFENLPCPLAILFHIKPLDIRNRLTLGKSFCARICRNKFPRIQDALYFAMKKFGVVFLFRKFHEAGITRNFFQLVKIADKFVLLSEKFFPEFPPFKTFPHKIAGISNPATFEAPPSVPAKQKEILFVGRIKFEQKRPDFLLKIWAKLENRFPDWKLKIVGTGSDEAELKRLSQTLGLKNVDFEGFQSPQKYYERAAIFAMTSAYEGFGMVLVEAAAFACVPVAFNSFASVTDIISDNENGVLVPAFDLEKYAEKLAELMENPSLRERLGNAAKSGVSRFSAPKIAEKWESLFFEILEKRSREKTEPSSEF